MEMSVSSEMTFFTTKQQSEICPHLRTGSSAEDRGRIDTRRYLGVDQILMWTIRFRKVKVLKTTSNAERSRHYLMISSS